MLDSCVGMHMQQRILMEIDTTIVVIGTMYYQLMCSLGGIGQDVNHMQTIRFIDDIEFSGETISNYGW